MRGWVPRSRPWRGASARRSLVGRSVALCAGVAATVLLVGALQSPVVSASAGSDWPEHLHDASGSGFSSETIINTGNASRLKMRTGWPVALTNTAQCPSANNSCSSTIVSQAVIGSFSGLSLVFVSAWNGSEYALCAAACTIGATTYPSGHLVWSTYLGRTSGCHGPTTGTVWGPSSASSVTSATIGGQNQPLVFVTGGGDIDISGAVIANASAKLFALNALTGAVLWQTPLGSAPHHFAWSSPVVANNSVYAGLASLDDCPAVAGQVFRIDELTGQQLNTFDVVPSSCKGGGVWGSPVVDANGNVFVATGNPIACKLPEPYAPALLEFDANLNLLGSWQVPVVEQTTDSDFGSTPTLFSGTVIPNGQARSLIGVPNKNGTYYVFDENAVSNGPLARLSIAVGGSNPEAGNGSIAPASWDGTHLYVAGGNTTINGVSYKGSLRAFDPNSLARPLWELGLSGHVLAAVSSVPGLAFVGSGNVLNVVNSSTGQTVFKTSAGKLFAAPSIAYGVIYVGDTSGKLRAFSVGGA